MIPGNGPLSVPPGFRFHPTDEELLYYYLKKKVAYEPIDLDVIRDIDLNKIEPWDLKDRCGIGSGPQNEWYFFCHKDKKYPTGTRTNRATNAGFWKATGRDKSIHLPNSTRIGMRKTLVFYTGRAPHGQKTDWIMHEYRLEEAHSEAQEEGWVVCRAFKKKNHQRGAMSEASAEENQFHQMKARGFARLEQKHPLQMPCDFSVDNSMHLPQLLSSESIATPFSPSAPFNLSDIECSQNLIKLTGGHGGVQQEKFNADWSILEKLLTSHQNLEQIFQSRSNPGHIQSMEYVCPVQRFPLQYLGCETDLLKFTK